MEAEADDAGGCKFPFLTLHPEDFDGSLEELGVDSSLYYGKSQVLFTPPAQPRKVDPAFLHRGSKIRRLIKKTKIESGPVGTDDGEKFLTHKVNLRRLIDGETNDGSGKLKSGNEHSLDAAIAMHFICTLNYGGWEVCFSFVLLAHATGPDVL